MNAATLAALLTLAINLAVVIVVVRFGLRVLDRLKSFDTAINRWRVLDLATRAESHATNAQQLKMAALAADGNMVELESLARVVLASAWKQAQKS
jgi:hypothetical protein